jgi:glycosyltransferase involved in cell wall biosynthesis
LPGKHSFEKMHPHTNFIGKKMSLNLIIRLDSLRPPLGGIGHYTYYLLNELLHHPEINRIVGLSTKGIQTKQALLQTIQTHSSDSTHPSSHNTSQLIQKIPGAYPLLKKLIDIKESYSHKPYQSWLYHEPSFIALKHQGPTVVTVHDLSHMRYPQTHPKCRVDYLNKKLPETLKHAEHIIVDSAFTRNELLELDLVKDDKKISVVHLGVEPLFQPRDAEAITHTLNQFNLRARSYILAASTLVPRKNLPRLLQAYDQLPDQLKSEFPLVLAGASGWQNQQLVAMLQTIKSPGKVICTGYVAREILAQLMSGAAAFAFPSLYEGFGLPVLEAMASGVPVLTSNNSSLKEIAADCALLVDPLDVEDIANKLSYLLEDREQAERLKQCGIEHARGFTWRRCAELTVRTYMA